MTRRKRRAADADYDLDWLLAPYDAVMGGLRAAWSSLKTERSTQAFALLFLFALAFRLLQPDWYSNRLFHPDERWIFDKTAELHVWAEPGKTDGAGLQYGSLPMYVVAFAKDAAHLLFKAGEHAASIVAGRSITGLVDAVTVLGTFLLALQLMGAWPALLAALLVACSPLHIQLSHFFTVDPWLACFATLTLAAGVRLARKPSLGLSAGIGVLFGAALASKSSGLPLVVPILLAHLWPAFDPGLDAKRRTQALKQAGLGLAVAAGSTLLAFFIFMPWAFLKFGKFVQNQTAQRDILVTGSPGGVPYVRQYWDTSALFHLKNIAVFYLGLPAGLLALLAAPLLGVLALISAFKAWAAPAPKAAVRKAASASRQAGAPAVLSPSALWYGAFGPLLLLGWVVPYFLITGFSFAKFARYMLPILPALSVLLVAGLGWAQTRWARAAKACAWVLAVTAVGYGLGYAATYLQPHPWIEASRWTYQNIPARTPDAAAPGGSRATRILNEDWGDDLPVEVDGQVNARYEQLKGRAAQVNIVEWDSANKLARLSTSLSQADVLFLADPRAYGTYLRLPTRFPLTHAYYDLLFSDPGRLGFELVHESSNPIRVFGIPLPDSRTPKVPRALWADESFTLYDRPHAFIFKRKAPMSEQQVNEVLRTRIKELGLSEGWLSGQGPDELHRIARGGAAPEAATATPAAMDPSAVNPNYGQDRGALRPLLHPVLAWWVLVLVLGWLALPLTLRLFRGFPAGGYALSKALGVFLFGWLAYNLAWLKLLLFKQAGLWALLAGFAVLGLWWVRKHRAEAKAWVQANRTEMLFSEAVFAAAFLFFVAVRAFNPNIHDITGQGYFGGGEPLGMTYLSAITRCVTFPAYDPWLALHNSSYYYFGYVLAATLTKLSGFAPAITYNLSLALFFSLALLSAYGVLRGLVAKRWLALGGAAMVSMAGTLWTVGYVALQSARGSNPLAALFSHGFIWDPTRFPELVNGHIFEFPYFSYLYSDLHPHNMVVGFSLLLLGLLLTPFLSREGGWRSLGPTPALAGLWVGVTALLLDAQYALNTWSWPVFLVLTTGALLVGTWAGKGEGLKRAAIAALWGLLALVAVLILGRVLMFGFRHYYLQNGANRIGHVLPNEWQMSAYIPLAYYLGGLLALAALAGQRVHAFALDQAKLLGWEKLKKKDLLDRVLLVPERLFDKRPVFSVVASLWAAVVGLLLFWALVKFSNQGVMALALGLGFACLGFFVLGGWRSGAESFLWLLGAFTCFLVAGSEWFFVADRMNTIFKFWFNGWILMGLVFGAGFGAAWGPEHAPLAAAAAKPKLKAKPKRRKLPRLPLDQALPWIVGVVLVGVVLLGAVVDASLMGRGGRFIASFVLFAGLILAVLLLGTFYGSASWWRAVQRGLFGGLLGLGLLYPLGATVARINEASQFKDPHLDGLSFMAQRDPRPGYDAKDYDKDDYALIQWLNANAPVTETVVEAPGTEMYKGYNRFAIYTGLPTLLGWDYQVGQQLGERTGGLLNQRKRDAAIIYGPDAEAAKALLKQYRARWIVVGAIERRAYPGPGLDKFAAFASVALQSGPSVLYRFDWDKE